MLNLATYKQKVQEDFGGAGEKPFYDQAFLKLINMIRPDLKYYEMRLGDKMLFLRRVRHLEYDIVEEEELRRQRLIDLELEKARQLRDAGK